MRFGEKNKFLEFDFAAHGTSAKANYFIRLHEIQQKYQNIKTAQVPTEPYAVSKLTVISAIHRLELRGFTRRLFD